MLTSYTAPDHDLGAFVFTPPGESAPVWIGLFGSGYDGEQVRLVCHPEGGQTYRVTQQTGTPGSEWPAPKGHAFDVGTLTIDGVPGETLTLTYSLDRYALGYPEVDFSPQPPRETTGSVTLIRLA